MFLFDCSGSVDGVVMCNCVFVNSVFFFFFENVMNGFKMSV